MADAGPAVARAGAPNAFGALVPVLLLLTVISGCVDAAAYLGLGRVFVANMTGNLLFLGFAIAGAPVVSVAGSAISLVSFLVGVFVVGRAIAGGRTAPRPLVRNFTAVQAALFAGAAGLARATRAAGPSPEAFAVIALLALAMGIQVGGVRQLAVPGLERTTVVTSTLTALALSLFVPGRPEAATVRLLLSAIALFLGALTGALLWLHAGVVAPLVLAAVLAAGASVTAAVAAPA